MEQEEKKPIRKCDHCDKPGIWNLRARTKFLCEECRRILEWERA